MNASYLFRRMAWLSMAVVFGCSGGAPETPSATHNTPASSSHTTATPATSAPRGNGVLTGTVSFSGTTAATPLQMAADPICEHQHPTAVTSEEVLTAGGQLANVLVYLKDGLAGGSVPAPSTKAILDQKGCLYVPHVLAVQTGQSVEIRNSDATLHNVNAKPTGNRAFNIAQPVQGMTTTKTFTTMEIGIPLKCNVHPWMAAYIHVLDHPYFAVSSATGAFTITGLPAGTYTVEAWHETLGTKTQQVTVSGSGTQQITFSF